MTGADQGRAAFEREAWADAYAYLAEADTEMLELDDLERLSVAAYLTGHAKESLRYWERAHHGWAARGDVRRAARATFWLVFELLNQFDLAIGSGWIERTHRMLEHEGDCVEIGYMRYLRGLLTAFQGDPRPPRPSSGKRRRSGSGSEIRSWRRSRGSGADGVSSIWGASPTGNRSSTKR